MADDRCGRTALRDGRLGRVVCRVEVDVRYVSDQAVGPAIPAHPRLLARHELECPVRAEVQDCIRAEVFAHPAVEGAERVRRREATLEQKPHRVALDAKGRLHPDGDVAELRSEHMDAPRVRLVLSGCGAPNGFDLVQVRFRRHVSIGRNRRNHIRLLTEQFRIPVQDRVPQLRLTRWHFDIVAIGCQATEHVQQRSEHGQMRGRADRPGVGWEAVENDPDLALALRQTSQRDLPCHARRKHVAPLRVGGHVVATLQRTATENGRIRRPIDFRQGNHHRGLDRGQPMPRGAPRFEGLELDRVRGMVGNV